MAWLKIIGMPIVAGLLMEHIYTLKQQANTLLAQSNSGLHYHEQTEFYRNDGMVHTTFVVTGFGQKQLLTMEINIQLDGTCRTGLNPINYLQVPDWTTPLMSAFGRDLWIVQSELNNFIKQQQSANMP